MAIKVKFFASLREKTGRAEGSVEFSNGLTASEVWARATDGAIPPEKLMVAVNMEYVKGDPVLQDNDEVAFFPPVTGG